MRYALIYEFEEILLLLAKLKKYRIIFILFSEQEIAQIFT